MTQSIIVNGAGPSGLAFVAAFLFAAKQSPTAEPFNIYLIEKRDFDFKRGQKLIVVDDPTANHGVRWDQFCKQIFFADKELTYENYILRINGEIPEKKDKRYKLVQKFFHESENLYPTNVSIKQLQNALLEHIEEESLPHVRLHLFPNTAIERMDIEKKCVYLREDNQPIYFDYFINAEGEKRETVHLINDAFRTAQSSFTFQYGTIGNKPTEHMAVKIRVKLPKDANYRTFLAEKRAEYRADQDLKNQIMRWVNKEVIVDNKKIRIRNLPFLFDPNLYKEHQPIENWVPKFFVAGPIPRGMHEMRLEDKPAILLVWAQNLIANQFKLPPDILEIDTGKNHEPTKLSAQTFSILYRYCVKPICQTENGLLFAMLGDVAMSAYYIKGISSTMGLNEAIFLANGIIKKNEGLVEGYQNQYSKYLKYIVKSVNKPTIPPLSANVHVLFKQEKQSNNDDIIPNEKPTSTSIK